MSNAPTWVATNMPTKGVSPLFCTSHKRGQSFIFDAAQGFSLLETLIALTIAVLLVTVAASTLSVTLRAERAMDRLEDGRRLSEEWLAEWYSTGAASNTLARNAEHWLFTMTEVETGPADDRVRWSVWEIAPRDRPSAAWRLSLLQPDS